MSKFVRIHWPDQNHVPERRNWRKSFPANSVTGRAWIVDVLADLAEFADHEGIDEIGCELRDVRGRVAEMLDDKPCPMRRGKAIDDDPS